VEPAKTTPNGRIEDIEILRGLAVVMVLVFWLRSDGLRPAGKIWPNLHPSRLPPKAPTR